MKKRTVGVLLAAFFAMALTGCGDKQPQPGEVKGYDKGEEYLSIWVHSIEDTEEGQCYRKSVDAFNKKYDGKYFADIEFIPRNDSGGGYSDKINASVMSGDLPDVLTVDGPNIAAYAENGIIQPLAKLTDEEKSVYLDSIIQQGTYNNKLYALGAMESSVGLYYNKDILAEAGVEVPDADHPWTWSEFTEVLKKVQPVVEKKKGYALDMTFPTGEATIYYYAPFFWSNGGDFVSKDGLKVNGVFNSKENLETVNYFKSFLDNGYMSKVQITDLFESGRYTPTGSWAFAASSKTKKLKGATKLVQWMSGVESGKRLWDESKSFPSTYEAFESSPIFEEDENYKALYHQLSKYGHPRSKTPVYPQVSASVQEVLENSVLTDKDAKTELDKSVERINAKLKRYVMK
ncbi:MULTISPECIES: ABC transporter substrate-binding protein [Dorea]|uniref:ABC transporter substrate-binding protein n=1 Tax=Dorea TaxID=189330 RepID=UPI0018AB2C5B|nr:sugar ABC transporter substrate-binding protein [Dorea longicatena]